MSTILSGLLIDGDASGTLATFSRLTKIRISTSSALIGTLTLAGAGGNTVVSTASLNGVQTAGIDLYGPVFFSLSNPADIGKASVSWSFN